VTEAARRLFPALSLKYEDLAGTEYSKGREYKGKTYAVEAQQSVYRGGEYWIVIEQAKINLKISRANRKKIKDDLILSVKKAFYSMIRAEETLVLQEDFLKKVETILRSVEKQHAEGVCPELEYLDVQGRYSQAYFQYMSAEEDLKLAEVILKQAMNLGHEENVNIKYSLDVDEKEIDIEECFKLALDNNPDIKISELSKEYASLGKKLVVAKKYPKVDLLGSYGASGEAYLEDTLTTEDQWYLGTKVQIPIGGSTGHYSYTTERNASVLSAYQGTESSVHSYKFNFFDDMKYFSKGEEADIELEEAEHALSKAKKEALLSVEENFYNCEKALIHVDAARNKVKFQTKETEIYKLKRGMGAALDSQVVESVMKLTQEKFSLVQAITDYYSALAGINRSIGLESYF